MEMSMSRLNIEQNGLRMWMLDKGKHYNDRSEREGNGAGMDGEQNIFMRGPTGSGEE
jgi:hypothetical protein